ISILSPTFISPRQPPSFTPWLLISRVCARWLSLLPAIQSRTGTTDLVLFDRRFPFRNRGCSTLTPSSRRRSCGHELHFLCRRLCLPPRPLPRLALVEGEHRELPTDQAGLSRGMLDVSCSCTNGAPRTPWANAATIGRATGIIRTGARNLASILLRMRSATVIAFATADSRDSSRSEHSLGVENRFHVDVEGFQIAAHLGQAAYRLDDTVYLVRRDFMHFDSEFQIVLRRFRVVFGGLWLLAPQSPSQHPKKVDQRTAAANSACIMRTVADGFTTSTEHGVEQGNCAQASVGMGSCVHIRTS